jgi:hypothetical protein
VGVSGTCEQLIVRKLAHERMTHGSQFGKVHDYNADDLSSVQKEKDMFS